MSTDTLFNTLKNAPARPWSTTEEADMSCHPLMAHGWLWLEEDSAVTQAGDRIEAIGDNLYRVIWNTELMDTHGEFSIFTALEYVMNAVA